MDSIVKYCPICLFIIIFLSSCQNNEYSPKPYGYYKINLPEKVYHQIEFGCPYTFIIPQYASLSADPFNKSNNCWNNIEFKQFNARLHLSYYKIEDKSKLENLSEDARTFAFKHTSKATAIDQEAIYNKENKIYGLKYLIKGNTASNFQFYVTDSTKNYLRGALYFNEKPNIDSIQPVLNYLKDDINKLITSLRWK